MVIFWTFVISAIRICQDCNDIIFGKHGRETRKVYEKDKNVTLDYVTNPAYCRFSWGK